MALKVGIIGCGGIARGHLRGWLAISDKAEVVAFADIDAGNLAWFKETAGGGRTFKDYKQMLARTKLDAVDICLPHHLHTPAILAACKAKVHWICEKPLCLDLKEADTIDKAVKKSGVVAMMAQNQVFMPAILEAKRWLLRGDLGRVYSITSQDCFILGGERPGTMPGLPVPSPIAPDTWRADLKKMGGGELIDTGYHPTYRLLYLAGEAPAQVKAVTGRYRQAQLPAEDTATVLVKFPSGVTGTIRTSWAHEMPADHHAFHIVGEKGQLYGGGSTIYFKPNGWQPARFDGPEVETLSAEVAHFVMCLLENRRPVQTHEDGIAVLRLITAAYEDAAAG